MARINSLGYVVATGVPVSATSIPCNKIAIQALPTTGAAGAPVNAASELIYVGKASMNKATGVGVIFILAPGQTMTIGDEVEDDVLDANRDVYVDSSTGAGVVCGLVYQR